MTISRYFKVKLHYTCFQAFRLAAHFSTNQSAQNQSSENFTPGPHEPCFMFSHNPLIPTCAKEENYFDFTSKIWVHSFRGKRRQKFLQKNETAFRSVFYYTLYLSMITIIRTHRVAFLFALTLRIICYSNAFVFKLTIVSYVQSFLPVMVSRNLLILVKIPST